MLDDRALAAALGILRRSYMALSEVRDLTQELTQAVEEGGREAIFRELHKLVPTFREADQVNQAAIAKLQERDKSRQETKNSARLLQQPYLTEEAAQKIG